MENLSQLNEQNIKETNQQKCHICDKEFEELEAHFVATHEFDDTSNNQHQCTSCGKLFSGAVNLKKHISTVHEGLKNYKCESCDKSFSYSGHLKRHILTVHEGHKDYKCQSCAKAFSEAGI